MSLRAAIPGFALIVAALAAVLALSATPNTHTAMQYPYVYVLPDGSARELHENERRYLETEFSGGDGNMPYIKDSYEARNGWGEIKGYLERARLPSGTPVAAAPVEDPSKPLSREDTIAFLRSKGVDVVENPDGSFGLRPHR